MTTHPLEQQVTQLPTATGVYLLRNDKGQLIYVGKAKNLRNRVRSYLTLQEHDSQKTKNLKAVLHSFEYIVVRNEVEALVLEENLIKKHKPKFNILLKDDKRYLYIRITTEEAYPSVYATRDLRTKKTSYVGPFTSGRDVYATIHTLRKLFKFRTCKKTLFNLSAKRKRPCLDYHINLCTGPCIGMLSEEEYRKHILQCKRFLLGYEKDIIRSLTKEMKTLAREERFEEAAVIRDRLQALIHVRMEQQAVLASTENTDVFGLAHEGALAICSILIIREGKLIDCKNLVLHQTSDENGETLIESSLINYYEKTFDVPDSLLLPFDPPSLTSIKGYLSRRRGILLGDTLLPKQISKPIRIVIPQRGDRKKLIELAEKNAYEFLIQMRKKHDQEEKDLHEALTMIQKYLKLSSLPERIECYDISHLGGTNTVGAMIVFEGGRPKKSHYRKFSIRQEVHADDYLAMQELVQRRLERLRDGTCTDPSFTAEPDLLLIDGGKGQLSAVVEILLKSDFQTLKVASLAKREEELFLPEQREPIILPRNHPSLYLIQRIRDEAHRFAITFQRRKRKL